MTETMDSAGTKCRIELLRQTLAELRAARRAVRALDLGDLQGSVEAQQALCTQLSSLRNVRYESGPEAVLLEAELAREIATYKAVLRKARRSIDVHIGLLTERCGDGALVAATRSMETQA